MFLDLLCSLSLSVSLFFSAVGIACESTTLHSSTSSLLDSRRNCLGRKGGRKMIIVATPLLLHRTRTDSVQRPVHRRLAKATMQRRKRDVEVQLFFLCVCWGPAHISFQKKCTSARQFSSKWVPKNDKLRLYDINNSSRRSIT